MLFIFSIDAGSRHGQVSNAKSRCFLKLLKDTHAIVWLHMLLDVISCLSDGSTMIQTKHVTVSDVWLELQSAKRIISSYVLR